MLGSGELPGLTWTWEEKVMMPQGFRTPPNASPIYYYEVRLSPTEAYIPLDHFLGFRLPTRKPLSWFGEGLAAFLSRLSPTLSWDNFPLIFDQPPAWDKLPRFSFFAVEEEDAQAAYSPCDLLLLALLELYLSERPFLPLLWQEETDETDEWFHFCLSPQQALSLVPVGPLGTLLQEGEERKDFLTTPGQGLFVLPEQPELQGYQFSSEKEGVALAVLLHLLVPEERERAVAVVEAYRRWQEELQPEDNLYEVLHSLPWDDGYDFPDELWQALLSQEGERALTLGRAFYRLVGWEESTIPFPRLLSILLETEPLTSKEFETVARTWYKDEALGEHFDTAVLRLILTPSLRFLQVVEAEALPLSFEERCRLWQAVTFFVFHYPAGPNVPRFTHRYLLMGGDFFLLPALREALGLAPLVRLLLRWEEDEALTAKGVEEFITHPSWWDCPPSWWLPLLAQRQDADPEEGE